MVHNIYITGELFLLNLSTDFFVAKNISRSLRIRKTFVCRNWIINCPTLKKPNNSFTFYLVFYRQSRLEKNERLDSHWFGSLLKVLNITLNISRKRFLVGKEDGTESINCMIETHCNFHTASHTFPLINCKCIRVYSLSMSGLATSTTSLMEVFLS